MNWGGYPFYPMNERFSTVQGMIRFVGKEYGDNRLLTLNGENIGYMRFSQMVTNTAAYLNDRYGKQKHIALIGGASGEWLMLFMAIMASGNVAVPIDPNSNVDDQIALIRQAKACLVISDAPIDFGVEGIELKEAYALWREDDSTLALVDPEDIAVMLFTSGTTGNQKACMLTHKNLTWNTMDALSAVKLTAGEKTLAVLPLHHAFEMTCGILAPLAAGMEICFNSNIRHLFKNMKKYRVETLVVVPLILEHIWKNIVKRVRLEGRMRSFDSLLEYSKTQDLDQSIRRSLFKEDLDNLDEKLRLIVVGGAMLNPDLVGNFNAMGIVVVQGYGATECSPVIACNTDRLQKYNSVGKVIPGVSVTIENGEICVSGPTVMKGYYNHHDECFDGKVYHTGDLGYLDEEGFLYVTGRKKNLIILGNGENISPEELEQKICGIPGIEEVMVYARGESIVADIVREKTTVESDIHGKIKEFNTTQPAFKQIKEVYFKDYLEKTSTMKLRR